MVRLIAGLLLLLMAGEALAQQRGGCQISDQRTATRQSLSALPSQAVSFNAVPGATDPAQLACTACDKSDALRTAVAALERKQQKVAKPAPLRIDRRAAYAMLSDAPSHGMRQGQEALLAAKRMQKTRDAATARTLSAVAKR